MPSLTKERIIVIRTGALGDLVFCFQSFHEIRKAHPEAEIALLTRKSFVRFGQLMPWFDKLIVDPHAQTTDIKGWKHLLDEVRAFAPTRIYDLQGKTRQSVLYWLLGGPFGPEWSGAAAFCKYPRPWPPKAGMHFMDFLSDQLRAAGVAKADAVDPSWLSAGIEKFALPEKYAVIIPGSSAGTAHKRWPAASYAALAKHWRSQGMPCVAVGTRDDQEAVKAVIKEVPEIIDLCGKDTLPELAEILRKASVVVGGDTGPIHIAGLVGTPTLGLYSGRSNPIWSKPPGAKTAVVSASTLDHLSPAEVIAAVQALMQ